MNNTIKRIILTVLFLCILGLGFLGLYKIFSWKDTSGDYFSCLEELKTLPDNTVDVVAVGPSRTYDSVNPAILWSEYGIASFDLAISGMAQESAYYHLKTLLKTQSPKIVLFEASLLYTGDYAVLGNKYRNTIVMDWSKENYELISKSVSKEEKTDYLLKWPIIHSRYTELRKGDFERSNHDNFNLGYEANFDVGPQDIDESVFYDTETVEITDTTREWIDRLVELSKENGFQIIFYHAPQNMSLYLHRVYLGACEYLEYYGIPVVDLSLHTDEMGFDNQIDFSDTDHLNVYGATKTSRWLAEYLKANYVLPDYRGIQTYEKWDKCSLYYSHQLLDNIIVNTGGYQQYVDTVLNTDNMLVVMADRLGVEVYLNGDSVWIYSEANTEFLYKVNSSEFLYMKCNTDEDGIKTTLYIGSNRVIAPENDHLRVVTYDLITDKLVEVKEY